MILNEHNRNDFLQIQTRPENSKQIQIEGKRVHTKVAFIRSIWPTAHKRYSTHIDIVI